MKLALTPLHAGSSDAENPFWISYSDLMMAAMIIFMTIMAITMTLIGKATPALSGTDQHASGAEFMGSVEKISKKYAGISVNVRTGVIDIGELVRFGKGKASLSAEAGVTLREFVKEVLAQQKADTTTGNIKSIVVEGYADQDGAYLYNLSLSLNRSRNVVCALLDSSIQAAALEAHDKVTLSKVLMVGGFSSNSLKGSRESSRRVEMKIVFSKAKEPAVDTRLGADMPELGNCPHG